LIHRAEQDDIFIENAEAGRFISKLNDEDSEILSDAIIEPLLLGRKSRIVKIHHGKNLYFCISGFPEVYDLPDGLEAVDMTPALFTCAILEGKVPPKATGFQIKQVIESEYRGVAGYAGHNLKVISELFPVMYAFKGNPYMDASWSSSDFCMMSTVEVAVLYPACFCRSLPAGPDGIR
jgi:hypothetical protein